MTAPYGSLTKQEIIEIENTDTKVYWVWGSTPRIYNNSAMHLLMRVRPHFFRNYWHAWAHREMILKGRAENYHALWDEWK